MTKYYTRACNFYFGPISLNKVKIENLNKINEGLSILARFFDIYKLKTLLNVLYETVLKNEGANQAENIARNELIQRPSLSALDKLFQAQAIGKTNKIDNVSIYPCWAFPSFVEIYIHGIPTPNPSTSPTIIALPIVSCSVCKSK